MTRFVHLGSFEGCVCRWVGGCVSYRETAMGPIPDSMWGISLLAGGDRNGFVSAENKMGKDSPVGFHKDRNGEPSLVPISMYSSREVLRL